MKNQFDWEDDVSLFNKEPILELEYAYIDSSKPRNEFEIKDKIMGELQKLKSDKVGHINTINIDDAIEIVREA